MVYALNCRFVAKYPAVGLGSRNYRKSCSFRTTKSKVTIPERPREESSTTALKAAAKTGGLNYPHKGKGQIMLRY